MLAFLLKRTLSVFMALIMAFSASTTGAKVNIVTENTDSDYLELSNSNKYIAQIVRYNAETFCPTTADDYSNPYYNYLPRGTVDYCNPNKVTDPESGKKYYVLASGMRVYAKSRDVKVYKGTLKKTKNTVSVATTAVKDNRTRITLNVAWKAPFKLKLSPQNYPEKSSHKYSVTSATYKYVDISFAYCNKASGKIDLNGNPLFYKYKWYKSNSNWVLRLYLKKAGGFYGWNSYYNGNGQLVFSFLNPPTLIKANNKYGFSLKGQTIWVDAGHGGTDGGTYAYSGGKSEKYYTLLWAKELATNLTNLGAKVIMTRTTDKTLSLSTRYTRIQASGADFGISLHFDGSDYSSASGFFTGYFQPFTLKPAKSIANAISSKKYLKTSRTSGVDFHYFNLSRTFTCPFVLTENGFLTSKSDFKKISDPAFRKKYVGAITDGIMAYFKSVSYKITDPAPKFTVEGCVTKTFNNAEQTQDLKVKYNGKTLKEGTDYTVAYQNNKWVGTATATVTLKGKYKGTKKLNFTIKPAPWGIKELTLNKNNITVAWKARTRQTSGFQILYSDTPTFKNAKTITVSGANNTSYTIKNLARGKTYYVRLRTYKYTAGVKYNSAYSKIKSITIKK